ncbi:MAG: XRE family transcriptional regulator [Rhizobium sp.]|nr:MAG: XRE family transcriptional regulator [Rhizobium sp.]
MVRKVAPPPHPTGLYYAREHRGMSQDQLAAESGALKPMISKLENGSRELTRAWAERFAGPLRLSAIRIVFWDKVGPPPEEKESEYEIPNPKGVIMRQPERPASATGAQRSRANRQKPLKTSVVKLYVAEWRRFMMGDKIEPLLKALGLTVDQYEEIEQYPFRLAAEELATVAKAIGVHAHQLYFPVLPENLTPEQKRLPAGKALIKRQA